MARSTSFVFGSLVASALAGCAAEPPRAAPATGPDPISPAPDVRIVPPSEAEPIEPPPEAAPAPATEAPPVVAPTPPSPPRPRAAARGRRWPHVRSAETMVCCRLPPEVITRVVRSKREQFAKCREGAGAERTQLSFVIAKDGSVRSASISAGSDAFKACMQSALSSLKFPAPEGGEVTVVYPLATDPLP